MTDAKGDATTEQEREARIRAGVRSIREGHGANCSSVGSVVDALFASAVVGGAIFAAVVASLAREKARVVGTPKAAGTAPLPAEPTLPSDGGPEEKP